MWLIWIWIISNNNLYTGMTFTNCQSPFVVLFLKWRFIVGDEERDRAYRSSSIKETNRRNIDKVNCPSCRAVSCATFLLLCIARKGANEVDYWSTNVSTTGGSCSTTGSGLREICSCHVYLDFLCVSRVGIVERFNRPIDRSFSRFSSIYQPP